MHNVLWDPDGFQENAIEVFSRVLLLLLMVLWEVFHRPLVEDRVFHQLEAVWSFLGVDLYHKLKNNIHILTKVLWHLREHSFQNLLV